MEKKSAGIVTPTPYFKIAFGCGNRAFYQVKSELYGIAEELDIEIQDGYITETCDYEGDLEEILIYSQERSELLISKVLEFYGVDNSELPEGMDVALTIF